MLETILSGPFWLALAEIVGVNILLSGDNAVVIALASRGLPARQRTAAVVGGSIGAIVMLIGFCAGITWLLTIPYLKLVSGLLLLWVGIKLLLPDGAEDDGPDGSAQLWRVVRTIIVADVVMSLDNVVAIAAVAKGRMGLIVAGLAVSVPVIIFGSQLMLRVLDRFPILVTAGAGLLGWIAGDIISGDPEIARWSGVDPVWTEWTLKPVLAAVVIAGGTLLARRAANMACAKQRGPV